MHVDDHLDAEVLEFLERTICTSAAGLFDVLGWPDPERVPVPLSMDKLETTYSHKRRMVGRLFDTRRLTTGMLPYKRERLIELLKEWTTKTKFTLKEVAQLLGTLDNHTKYARWARAWYFALSNNVRRSLEARYYALLRIQQRLGARIVEDVARDLPQALEKRLSVIIAREKARYLWLLNVTFSLTHEARECIQILLLYVTSNENPFETNLGLIVKRTPHFQTLGDACTDQGGGAFSHDLQFWFEVQWSPRVLLGCKAKSDNPNFVHINALEFLIVILQLVAVKVRLNTLPQHLAELVFPNGVPYIPVWHGLTDNTVSKSWESKATAKSPQGQALVGIYSQLLKETRLHTVCSHIAGVANTVADDISQSNFALSYRPRSEQLFQKNPFLKSYDYFLPSAELLHLLHSKLFSGPSARLPEIPKDLGHFVPAGSFISSTPSV
jgi:hypothetical protein